MFESVYNLPERGEGVTSSVTTLIPRIQSPSHRQETLVSRPDCDTDAVNYGWFLAPESWTREHGVSEPQITLTASQKSLPHFINKLKTWMAAWVTDGHSPIIHPQLYHNGMPECVEDAYTALAAYNAASPSGNPIALQITQNRLDKLLSQYQGPAAFTGLDGISPACLLDTPTHLARTQALFTYALVTLFDGDIRARAKAEHHANTLLLWCRQLLESAQLDCAAATMLSPPTPTVITPNPTTTTTPSVSLALTPPFQPRLCPPAAAATTTTTANPSASTTPSTSTTTPSNPNLALTPAHLPPPTTLWQTWIQSESARRIYLAATCMLAVYDTLRRGWAACPGGVAFTARRGLWEARSGWEWARLLVGHGRDESGYGDGDGGEKRGGKGEGEGEGKGKGGEVAPWAMVQSLEVWRILEGGRPGEVDEFTLGLMEISCGMENVERWCFERGGG